MVASPPLFSIQPTGKLLPPLQPLDKRLVQTAEVLADRVQRCQYFQVNHFLTDIDCEELMLSSQHPFHCGPFKSIDSPYLLNIGLSLRSLRSLAQVYL